MSREMTKQECKDRFLEHVRAMINYWDKEPQRTTKDKLEGLAFSILVAIDGEAGDLPKFFLTPDPHPDDKSYCQKEGIDWWPQFYVLTDEDRGMTNLHEEFFK